MRHVFVGTFFAGLIALAPTRAAGRPPPPPPPVATAPAPARPEIVPQDPTETAGMLRRLRIYLLNAPAGSTAFGSLGNGPQIWFVLPSCRPPQPDDPRDYCP